MSSDSLREKQIKLQLESKLANVSVKGSQQQEEAADSPHVEQANQEWRRFYAVIRQLTNDMRY